MLGYEDYRLLIAECLYEHELIDEYLYEKCKKPSYITNLPFDLRVNDPDSLVERMDAIDEELARREEILNKAEYRIGVKTRDTERLQKRVDKHSAKMDKAEEDIAKESDKIVKSISKLEDKIKKLTDEDTSSIESAVTRFKKAHNNLFDSKANKNTQEYQDRLDSLINANENLNNVLKVAFDNGWINKTDLKNGDSSANLNRVQKAIDKYTKAVEDTSKDMQRIEDNQVDIDYILRESRTVQKECELLFDEQDKALQAYLDAGGGRSFRPGVTRDGVGIRIPEMLDEMEALVKDTYKSVKDLRLKKNG